MMTVHDDCMLFVGCKVVGSTGICVPPFVACRPLLPPCYLTPLLLHMPADIHPPTSDKPSNRPALTTDSSTPIYFLRCDQQRNLDLPGDEV